MNEEICPLIKCVYFDRTAKGNCQKGIAKTGVACETSIFEENRLSAIKLLSSIFLTCPETDKEMEIKSVKGAEEGLDHVEIITKSDETQWKFKIFQEEI